MSEQERKAIVCDGALWFVRSIRLVEHDLDADEKVYRCNRHISGPHKSLAEVPDVINAHAALQERVGELEGALGEIRLSCEESMGPHRQPLIEGIAAIADAALRAKSSGDGANDL